MDANFVPGQPIDQERQALFDDKSFFMDPIVVAEAAENNGITDYNPTDYESPSKAINISADDIGVIFQKLARQTQKVKEEQKAKEEQKVKEREHEQGKKKRKRNVKPRYVEHSVVHFQSSDGTYVFNGHGMAHVLGLVLGFMAFNGMLSNSPLVFFTDGARCIHDEIEKMFSFTKFKIVLNRI
ncbi:MAG: hypothetical protein LBP92_11280 [Deltaproteobacteria bacterium]|nr:hypothetical protein [Deltaproteobacteria bacterium]